MAKEFVIRVGQQSDNQNFDWVIRGMGKYTHILRVEEVLAEEFDEPIPMGESEYLVFHTGPNEALYSVPGEGFVYPDSPVSDDENPIPRPWNPQTNS